MHSFSSIFSGFAGGERHCYQLEMTGVLGLGNCLQIPISSAIYIAPGGLSCM